MKRRILSLLTGVIMLLPFMQVQAAISVIDISNLSRNTVTSIQMVQDVAHQVTQIQNQIRQYEALLESLKRLDKSTYHQVKNLVRAQTDDYNQIFGDIDKIGFGLNDIGNQFNQLFPADSNWENIPYASYGGYYKNWTEMLKESAETAMKAQSVVERTIDYNSEIEEILKSSEAAGGEVRQLQAQNQMIAVLSQQMSDLTTALAANGRVASSAAAKAAAEEEAKRAKNRMVTQSLLSERTEPTEAAPMTPLWEPN